MARDASGGIGPQHHALSPPSQTALRFPPFVVVLGNPASSGQAVLRRAPRANSRAASPPPPKVPSAASQPEATGLRLAPAFRAGPRWGLGGEVWGDPAHGAYLCRCTEPTSVAPRSSRAAEASPRRSPAAPGRAAARASRRRSAAPPRLPAITLTSAVGLLQLQPATPSEALAATAAVQSRPRLKRPRPPREK